MKNQVVFKINTVIENESISFSETELETSDFEFDPMAGIDAEILISDGDNEVSVTDELWYLAINACFRASNELSNGQSFEFSQYTSLGTVNFVFLGDETIVATEEETATFKGDLSHALRACGDRILAFLISKFFDDEDFSFTIKDVKAARDRPTFFEVKA